MTHEIIYCGAFDRNFKTFAGNASKYKDAGGETLAISDPSEKVDGIVFGYMETADKQFVAVRANDFKFKKPLPLDRQRHMGGKGFGPKGSLLGDSSARQLLEDVAALNPADAVAIHELKKLVGPVSPAK